jgi:hypothetical protein
LEFAELADVIAIKYSNLSFFERKNSENAFFPGKWLNKKTNGAIRKVLLKSFPMNGHFSRFGQS